MTVFLPGAASDTRRMLRFPLLALSLALVAAAPAAAATTKPLEAPSGLAFYKPPAKLPGKTHGDVIWSRPATGKSKLGGARTRLVLYRSVGARGKAVAVSGLVSVPKGKAPKGGFPVVSWAHGTTGIADKTAPTRLGGASEYIRESLLEAWIKKGYAVVRTDYEGLGTPGVHPYLIGRSEGRSVLDIVRAARELDDDVSARLAISGHSQGGHAALFAAALAPRWTPELTLRGTAPFAPASQLDEQVPLVRALKSPGPLSVLVGLIGAGIDAGEPQVELRTLLSPRALAVLPQADQRDMAELARPDSFGGIAPSDLFRPDADPSRPGAGAGEERSVGPEDPHPGAGRAGRRRRHGDPRVHRPDGRHAAQVGHPADLRQDRGPDPHRDRARHGAGRPALDRLQAQALGREPAVVQWTAACRRGRPRRFPGWGILLA